MPDLHQSRDAELEALLASEIGDRKKAVAAEILRRRQEAKVQKWSGAMFSLLVFSGPYWRKPSDFLFASRSNGARCISTRQYARLLASWTGSVLIGPETLRHSLRHGQKLR
jgi:hypothetical protein